AGIQAHAVPRLPWAPAFAGVTNGAGGAVQTHNALDHAPSAPPGLRAGLVEIGDVAGGSHVAEPRSARHRERGDRGFVLGDLRHDRLLRAVEDAAVGGDEVLRVTQAGEIAVDFRHDVTGHQVAAAHRVFRVGPVVHETYEGTEAAADLEHGFDPSDEIVRRADRRRGAVGKRG